MEKIIDLGQYVAMFVNWLMDFGRPFFDFLKNSGNGFIDSIEWVLTATPFYVVILIFTLLAYFKAGKGVALFTVLGLGLIYMMGFWNDTMVTLALILVSTITALVLGVPLGIWAAKSPKADKAIHPILDVMQTMPAFVYLIPAVLFFSVGKFPGAVATVIFAMPPAVRLTTLGIKELPKDVIEAALSCGVTGTQLLFKVELPLAMRTIFTGINQTIMMALSMVVIAGMIAAGGLGKQVLAGIYNLDIGLGFESGLAVVILAIVLDRITQAFGNPKDKINNK